MPLAQQSIAQMLDSIAIFGGLFKLQILGRLFHLGLQLFNQHRHIIQGQIRRMFVGLLQILGTESPGQIQEFQN